MAKSNVKPVDLEVAAEAVAKMKVNPGHTPRVATVADDPNLEFTIKDENTNPTGLVPVEDIILIKLDPVSDTVGSKGLIYAPDPHKERDQQAMTRATLIAVGGNAFEQWNDPIPKPGDRIVVKKYAGLPAKAGDIENLYRFASDNEVVAIET